MTTISHTHDLGALVWNRTTPVIGLRTLLQLAAVYVCSRSLILMLGMMSPAVVEPGQFAKGPNSYALSTTFLRWDCGWYLSIIRNGYSFSPTEQSSVNFFPAFPQIARSLHLLGLDPVAAGYLVSNLACFAACVLLWMLARDLYGPVIAWNSVLFFLVGPVTFFFSTIYSESMFLLSVVALFYAAQQRRWAWAGLFGMFAALSRSPGLLLVVPLLVEFLQIQPRRPYMTWPAQKWKIVFCFGPAAGLGIYMLYLWSACGNPLAFLVAASHWGRAITYPWRSVAHAFHYPDIYRAWFLTALVLAWLLCGLGCRQKLRTSHLVFVGMMILFYMSASFLEALPRYLSVLFPFYICLGRLAYDRPRLFWPLVAGSCGLLALSITMFVNGYWFT
jgi:hypothetical protein|tara:strand:+ start:1063 stop:2229 length:1167 start_codon:yes stop_codon:yes gene_type:complete